MAARKTASKWTVPRYAWRLTALSMLLTGLGLVAHEAEMPPPAKADDQAALPAARAAVQPPPLGHLIRVPLPITGNSDAAVKAQLQRLLRDVDQQRDPPVVVLEFGRDEDQTGAGSDFGRAYGLAQFLIGEELSGVRLVAYVPHRLTGHALLVAMACQEIVLHSDAQLGEAGSGGEKIDDVIRPAYETVYQRRQTLPAAVALGILDPALVVYRANVKQGNRWILADQLAAVQKEPGFSGYDTIVKPGETGNFNAEQLRSFGFVSRKVENRQDLAAALKVARLTDDPTQGGEWNAIRIDVTGPINPRLVTQLQRAVEDRMQVAESRGKPINFICVWIDSPGGSSADSVSLINYLEDLDRTQVQVVAYIPGTARADAALIAMACDEIVIEEDATLGGSGAAVIENEDVEDLVTRIREISKVRSGSWSPWAAMVDRKLVVHEYTRQGGGQSAFFGEEELSEQRDPAQWQQGEEIASAGSLLKLNGEQAANYGLVDHVAGDFAEFRRIYSLQDDPELVRRNWAHILIDSLRENCCLPWLLIFIGSSALISELSSPGLGVPGFVSLLCFALFFWLKVLDGTAGALEIVLFLTGVVCLAVEIFVIPGFGVFGLGGGAMVIVSLILASQTFVIPRNEYQLERLPYSLFTVIAAGTGVFVGILVMRRYAQQTPGLNLVFLAPPDDQEQAEMNRREALADYAYLMGKRGIAVTQLTPSGKVEFGDEVVDVVSTGDLIAKGSDVTVVDIHGNLVTVEAIEEK